VRPALLAESAITFTLQHRSSAHDLAVLYCFAQGLVAGGETSLALSLYSNMLHLAPDRRSQSAIIKRCLPCWQARAGVAEAGSLQQVTYTAVAPPSPSTSDACSFHAATFCIALSTLSRRACRSSHSPRVCSISPRSVSTRACASRPCQRTLLARHAARALREASTLRLAICSRSQSR